MAPCPKTAPKNGHLAQNRWILGQALPKALKNVRNVQKALDTRRHPCILDCKKRKNPPHWVRLTRGPPGRFNPTGVHENAKLYPWKAAGRPAIAQLVASGIVCKGSGFDAWNALSDGLETALKTLLAERKIKHAYNKLYDCGPGNGLAVEWFYEINESA